MPSLDGISHFYGFKNPSSWRLPDTTSFQNPLPSSRPGSGTSWTAPPGCCRGCCKKISVSTPFWVTPLAPSVALTQGAAASLICPRATSLCLLLPQHTVSIQALMMLKLCFPFLSTLPPSCHQSFIFTHLHHCNSSRTAVPQTTVPRETDGSF